MTSYDDEYRRTRESYIKPARARKGPTPEAKLASKIDAYLKKLTPRPIVTRANAGSWSDDAGRVIMGAKAGTSDKICLFPGGVWVRALASRLPST